MSWARRAAAPALLVVLTVVAWRGVLAVPFQYDDHFGAFGSGVSWSRLTEGVRPLLRLSYAVDHALWGADATGFHATNLALHVATVLGVWVLAQRRLGDGGGAAFVAAAVFAVQPAHAEVVAYVSGRSTGLMAALLVWALVAHERRAHAVAVVLAVLACLAKEVAVVFPALFVAWRARAWATGAVALAIAAAGMVVVLLLAASERYRALLEYSLALRDPVESLRANLAALPEMLSLWVRPWALSVDHAFDPRGVSAVPGAVLVAGLLVAAVAARRRAPIVTFAVAWVLLALAPTNSVIAKLDVVTEKPLYLAWLGPSLLAGAVAARSRWLARPLLAAVVVAGVIFTHSRVEVWKDARTLWADAAAKSPDNGRAWNNLGMAHVDAGERRAARAAFTRAVRVDAGNVDARRNLARVSDPWGW